MPASTHSRRDVLLVLCCTFTNAAAQVLIKIGAGRMAPDPGFVGTAIGILTTPALFAGYSMYGLSTLLLVLALRKGQLSLLYPVMALSYVWVSILSAVVFHESFNGFKVAGVAIIVGGVAVLGRSEPS